VHYFEGAAPMPQTAIRAVAPRLFAILVSIGLLAAASKIAGPAMAQSGSLVGTYDGGQMEIAAALELTADGRFNYGLSYGALDEEAAGKWTISGDRVLLTSNPVTAPRFILVSRGKAPDGMLQLSLDVPRGLSRQYFDAVITRANGQTQRVQLGENGLSLPFTREGIPISIRIIFPIFKVTGESVNLDPGSGYSVQFRFEPNDLNKVDFRAEPLKIANGDLFLDRHGRTIRFRRTRR
jgi:hypothetical protein